MKNLLSALTLSVLLLSLFACDKIGGNKGTTTKNGFRFVSHTATGAPKAAYGQKITFQYAVYLGDSMVFNTAEAGRPARPVILPDSADLVGQKGEPVLDALYLLGEGDSCSIYQTVDSTMAHLVPAHLKDKVKEIRYDIKMLDTESPEERAAEEAKMKEMAAQLPTLQAAMATTVADHKAGKLGAQTTTTKGGVKVITKEKGTGAAVQTGETVKVHYIGTLMDGTKFDDSFSRGATLDFPVGVGRMIPGFDEAVGTMTHGTKAVILIPWALAYGDQPSGPIPAKSDLAFYIDLQ